VGHHDHPPESLGVHEGADMDRRKALATTGAISLTATAAVVAIGSSMGLFGLADDGNTRIGKLSPIDSTSATSPATGTSTPPAPAAAPSTMTGTTPDNRDEDPGTAGSTTVVVPDTFDTSAPGSVTPAGDDGHFDDHDGRVPGSDDLAHDDD
jgi:hypothetical protein